VILASDWHVGQVFWSILWFFLFFMWIWLAIVVFTDVFRSHDMGGWAKALWCIFIIIFPFLGIFVYLIARGGKMHERALAQAQANDQAMRTYIRETTATGGGASGGGSGGASAADELDRLAGLKDKGVIDDAEFQKLKAKVVQ
jgi:Short C-terminal domain/Phospholipase_D-nuclease N-terminal